MKWIFGGMIILSVIYAFATGNAAEVSNAALNECQNAVQFLLVLMGSMCLWGGFLKIAERSGLTAVIAKILSPFTRLLFPSLKKDSKAVTAISMNITANLLGLGNAATPFGLKAMEQLHTLNNKSDTASNEMVIFVVMNTASLQLLPTTLASLRQSYGSSAPFEIIVPVWISSACALATALICACTLNSVKRKER